VLSNSTTFTAARWSSMTRIFSYFPSLLSFQRMTVLSF